MLLDNGREILIVNAPEPDTGLGGCLHLDIFQAEPHIAVYYRFGGPLTKCCEVMGIDDAHKLVYGVLVNLLGSWHVTQYLDGKLGYILDLGLPSVVDDPVLLKQELIIVVHQKLNLRILNLFLPISHSEKRFRQPGIASSDPYQSLVRSESYMIPYNDFGKLHLVILVSYR